ncbi:MAG: MBOAT family protein [Prevotella sp.]|nr:MBOAT family protein [Prevotella sp.]
MIFNSFAFLVFLPIAFVLFWAFSYFGKNVQNAVILALSIFFYGYWNWKFLGLLLGITAITFGAGWIIGSKEATSNRKKTVLLITLFLTIGTLFVFKYYNFFMDSLASIANFFGANVISQPLRIILPVGISFYIFTGLSYVIDVFKGRTERTGDWLAYFAYVTFFPALFSGPISRSTSQLPQYFKERVFDTSKAITGFHLILWGFFMKLCVADRVGLYVDTVYNNMLMHDGLSILLATFFYTFQLYCDFGGYSLIAIGVAKWFSIDLLPNFNKPYLSVSYSEYWKREHMSLTNWLMDYVYYPLIGSSDKLAWWNTCMIITFLISGLWHGAAWTFVLWGLYQGIFLVIDANMSRKRKLFEKKHNLKKKNWWILLTTCVTYIVVLFGLIFFRANTVSDALFAYKQIFTAPGHLFIDYYSIGFGFLAILLLVIKDYIDEYHKEVRFLDSKKPVVSIVASVLLLLVIVLLGVFDGGQFIYFQF